MPLENLGSDEEPKERVDSRVEERESGADLEKEIPKPDTGGHRTRKPNPRLPPGSECGPHNPRRSKCSKKQPPLVIALSRGLQGWWGCVVE